MPNAAVLNYITASGKSACITVKENEFTNKTTVGFVRVGPTLKDKEKGFEFEIPEGWHLVPMMVLDPETFESTGEPIMTATGEQKMRFEW